MKFLIDAHLPSSLKEVFSQSGHDAIHTLDLPDRNNSKDSSLNEISLLEERVVVTKDTDFYYSHVLQNRPWKLVLVRTGNLGLKETKRMFQIHLPEIEKALEVCSLVALNTESVSTFGKIHASEDQRSNREKGCPPLG
jgi:predicted nuclease of predicted toxin-antitoxin system